MYISETTNRDNIAFNLKLPRRFVGRIRRYRLQVQVDRGASDGNDSI